MSLDPDRYLVGGEPPAVVLPARIARALDRSLLDDFRRRARGLDSEMDAVLAAVHVAGLRYAEATAVGGRTPLPQIVDLSPSAHDLLDTTAVADWIGCKPRNVRDLHERGRLTGHKIGGRLLFTPEAVDGYLADRASLTRARSA